jgi:hypothetical protein
MKQPTFFTASGRFFGFPLGLGGCLAANVIKLFFTDTPYQ